MNEAETYIASLPHPASEIDRSVLATARDWYVDLLRKAPLAAYRSVADYVATTTVAPGSIRALTARRIDFEDGSRVILLDRGLVAAIASLSYLHVATIPQMQVDAPGIFRRVSPHEPMTFETAGNLFRYSLAPCRMGMISPGVIPLLSEEQVKVADIILMGGLAFIIAHEIGHDLLKLDAPHPIVHSQAEARLPLQWDELYVDMVATATTVLCETDDWSRLALAQGAFVTLGALELFSEMAYVGHPASHPSGDVRRLSIEMYLRRFVGEGPSDLLDFKPWLEDLLTYARTVKRLVDVDNARATIDRVLVDAGPYVDSEARHGLDAVPVFWDSVFHHAPEAGYVELARSLLGHAMPDGIAIPAGATPTEAERVGRAVFAQVLLPLLHDPAALAEMARLRARGDAVALWDLRRFVRHVLVTVAGETDLTSAMLGSGEAVTALTAALCGLMRGSNDPAEHARTTSA
jgi:hypothetical protein